MFDKSVIKNYLKTNVDNFKCIDFIISTVTEVENTLEVEAIVHNFSQHYKVYVTIDVNDLNLFISSLKPPFDNVSFLETMVFTV